MCVIRTSWQSIVLAVISLLAVGGLGRALHATLYDWNSRLRPALSIDEALGKAREAMGREVAHRYYCLSVDLYGNKNGQPRPGTWSLDFGAEDGSKKIVHVTLDGVVTVKDYLAAEPSVTPLARVADAAHVLHRFLDNEGLRGTITADDSAVTLAVNTRTYQVYAMSADGQWSDDLHSVIGPRTDGFIVRVSQEGTARQQDLVAEGHAVYWMHNREVYHTSDRRATLVVEVDFGPSVPREVINRIFNLFQPADQEDN